MSHRNCRALLPGLQRRLRLAGWQSAGAERPGTWRGLEALEPRLLLDGQISFINPNPSQPEPGQAFTVDLVGQDFDAHGVSYIELSFYPSGTPGQLTPTAIAPATNPPWTLFSSPTIDPGIPTVSGSFFQPRQQNLWAISGSGSFPS